MNNQNSNFSVDPIGFIISIYIVHILGINTV